MNRANSTDQTCTQLSFLTPVIEVKEKENERRL